MVIDYKLIGERIKEARINKCLTQEMLAEKIDVCVGYVSRIEKGTQVNLKRLAQISLVLDVQMEYLVAGVSVRANNYLDEELYEILINCTPEKQRLIYNMAKIVLDTDFD